MGLRELGIDGRVADVLEARGIKDLYPPQKEAWASIRSGRNVLVAIPTASGKSLVAYLAILHRFLATGKKALYIVPLRALASEKFEELQEFHALGLRIALSTGDLDEKDPRLGRSDVIVCTSEKADALLRHRSGWIEDVGCVVVDELHLLNDSGRGPTLEVILARFRALIPSAQIVGLSATVQNAREVAHWLDAHLVTSEWRPVQLKLGTYLGNNLEFLGDKPRFLESAGEPVTSLVEETLRVGGQCLVFVSTRRSAEAQAQRLAGPVRELLDAQHLQRLEAAVAQLDEEGEGSPAGKKLAKLVRAGVSYHTAGLDAKQRRFVEKAFREGLVKVICATPTLAAGVNTPARRVIVRDLTRFDAGEGNRPLPVMDVKQMMGRAGRPRYDPYGEAVLLVKDEDAKHAVIEEYLLGEPEPVTSKLSARAALQTHVLASVAGGYCSTREAVDRFFLSTLWATQQSDYVVRDALDDAVLFLADHEFLADDGEGGLAATLFGKRTSDLYIDPLSALRLREALEAKREPTTFGLLEAVAGCPDVMPLYLRQSDDWVQERFWPHHEELLVGSDGRDLEATMSYAKTAFLLEDWMEERHLDEVEERYQVGPGDIRMRLDNAAWLLHALRELARLMRADWQAAISDLSLRLEHGVKVELLPLIRLKGVGRVRARTLWRAGLKRPADLSGVPVRRIAELPGFGPALAQSLLVQVGDRPAEGGDGAQPPPAQTAPGDPGPPGASAPVPARAPDKGQVTLGSFGAHE